MKFYKLLCLVFFVLVSPFSKAQDSIQVYCIPGMGTDARVFHHLKIENGSIQKIELIEPFEYQNLGEYAHALASQIDTTQPFVLLGVSMGGMIASEMTKFLSPEKVFLVSSAKNRDELSGLAKLPKYFPAYRLMGNGLLKFIAKRIASFKDVTLEEDRALYKDMLVKTGAKKLRWQIRSIAKWDKKGSSNSIVHIHGNADKVLNIRNVVSPIVVDGGSHKMIINKTNELSVIIDHELSKLNLLR